MHIFTVMDKQLIILTCHVCCSDFLLLEYVGPVKQEETGGLLHLFLIYNLFIYLFIVSPVHAIGVVGADLIEP